MPQATKWIPAAPAGDAIYFEAVFTQDSTEEITRAIEGTPRKLLFYADLPSGEVFAVLWYYADWHNQDLMIPQCGEAAAYLFSTDDLHGTGRPARIVFGDVSRDGQTAVLTELGGYKLMGRAPTSPFAVLSRSQWKSGTK